MKPRLLFVVESGTDVRLVEGLAEHFDLTVLARKIEGGVEISQPPSATVPLAVGPAGRAAFARFVFREQIRRRAQTDIVLVQGYSLAALAVNIARRITGVPALMLVCSPVEAYYRCRMSYSDGRSYRRHEAFILRSLARANAIVADRYVVLSRHLEDVVRGHGARRVSNIPIYGVDTRIFTPPPVNKHQLKQQLNLPAEGTLIFFSSRVAPEKDSETLLRAVRRLLDEGHNLWLLHRSGGYRQFLYDAEKFGVHTRVIATDAVHPHQQLPLDYQACDICVQASREEGLGFSPLEALACETPVVATSVGGLKETIIDGRTGWSYPVGDDHALATALREVIEDPDEAHRRARNGREMVCARFDRQFVFAEFSHLVKQSLAQNGTAAQNIKSRLRRAFSWFGPSNYWFQMWHLISNFSARVWQRVLVPFRRAPQNSYAMADSDALVLPHSIDPTLTSETWKAAESTASSQRKLNVLFAIHTARDRHTAVYRNTCERAAYLEGLGYNCTIVTPEDFPTVNRFGARLTPLLYPIALTRYLAKHKTKFDVASFHSYAGWAVSFLQRFLGKHRQLRTAIMFHGLEPLHFSRLKQETRLSLRYRLLHGYLMQWLLRASCRHADLVICLNTDEERYLIQNRWARRDHIAVISNPAPEAFFIERNHAPRATRLLFVGQWLPMKGTRYLVEAFTRLNRECRELRLCCAGTLASEATVMDDFPSDVRPYVTVRSRIDKDDLVGIHQESDIFLFPTLSEGFSLALTEAMASGLPIVTKQVGAAPDVLRQNESAIFIPTRDTEALVASVKRLIDDRPLREKLGSAARLAAEKLHPEDSWRGYGLCFERLTASMRTTEATLENGAISSTTELCRSKS